MTSATPAQRTISAGRRSWAPFQIDARLVVAVVLGPDELAAQALLELAQRRVAEHVGDGRCLWPCRVRSLCAEVSDALNAPAPDLASRLAAA